MLSSVSRRISCLLKNKPDSGAKPPLVTMKKLFCGDQPPIFS
jgi:hypothetical protein